jgi:hypothetical protein
VGIPQVVDALGVSRQSASWYVETMEAPGVLREITGRARKVTSPGPAESGGHAAPEDVTVTRDLYKAGKLVQIELLDHPVTGQRGFASLPERRIAFAD